jgi:hypothetical protein
MSDIDTSSSIDCIDSAPVRLRPCLKLPASGRSQITIFALQGLALLPVSERHPLTIILPRDILAL